MDTKIAKQSFYVNSCEINLKKNQLLLLGSNKYIIRIFEKAMGVS
jgi:hypothetical protein